MKADPAVLKAFAMRLRKLRVQAGLSQMELARRTGLSLQAIFHAEKEAHADARLTTLVALAKALACDLNTLCGF